MPKEVMHSQQNVQKEEACVSRGKLTLAAITDNSQSSEA